MELFSLTVPIQEDWFEPNAACFACRGQRIEPGPRIARPRRKVRHPNPGFERVDALLWWGPWRALRDVVLACSVCSLPMPPVQLLVGFWLVLLEVKPRLHLVAHGIFRDGLILVQQKVMVVAAAQPACIGMMSHRNVRTSA